VDLVDPEKQMVDPAKGLSEIPQTLLVPDPSPNKWELGDPLLNYFALGLLIFVVALNSYVIIAILRKLIRKARHTRDQLRTMAALPPKADIG
jgi:hypothetical protein